MGRWLGEEVVVGPLIGVRAEKGGEELVKNWLGKGEKEERRKRKRGKKEGDRRRKK